MKEHPYWWDTVATLEQSAVGSRQSANPQSVVPQSPRAQVPSSCDIAIVGGGYTGLAAARHLARAGATVVVFEREQIGWGASSRNGGQVLTGLKLDPSTLVQRFGEARARELFDVGRAAIEGLEAVIARESIDCEYTRSGHVQAAWKASHFDGFRDEQALLARVFNHPVHLLSRSEQRAELGSDRYFGVMVDERSGAINPALYVRGLAAAAARAGATIAAGTAVTRLERHTAGSHVTTAAGAVEARHVLLATNGYTDSAAGRLRRRLIPIGSYIIATEPLDAAVADALLPRRRMAFDSKNFLYYFRVTSDRRLLFGGRAEFGRPDPESTRRAARILRAGMIDVFPELANARIDYAWSGNVAFTRDQMPHAGQLDGVYYAGGYCGHGVAMATYLGEQIARRIAGEAITHPFFDDRFAPIPLYTGTPWFLPLVGAYYQVKDWLE